MKTQDYCVYLIDDDEGMLDSLKMLFNVRKIPHLAFLSAEEFLNAPKLDLPSCILLDLRMPGMSGHELLTKLAETNNRPPVIILTGHGSIETAVESMKQGAFEFLQKPCDSETLVAKINAAIEFDRKRISQSRELQSIQDLVDQLTAREEEVVRLLLEGKTSAQIAGELDIKQKSIDIYRSRILQKLGFETTAELISTLLRNQIVT